MTVSNKIKDWFGFTVANYRYYFFTILFFSLLIAKFYFNSVNTDLYQFEGRMMGEATVNGVDVAKRVSGFYTSGFIFILSSIVFYFLFYVLFKRQNKLKWLQLPNMIGLGGSIVVFFNGMGYIPASCVGLVLGLIICSLIFVLVKKKYISELNEEIYDSNIFTFLNCLSLSLFFLLKELFSVNLNLAFFLPIAFILFLGLILFVTKKRVALEDIVHILFPLALLPLLSLIKNEVYLILNGKNIHFLSPPALYIIILMVLSGWIVYRYYSLKKRNRLLFVYEIVNRRYLPFMLIGVAAYSYYEPFYTNSSVELFERANGFLPVMEFYNYNVLPLVQKFNSHMLSDFVTIFLYALFNKLEGMSPLIYDFIFPSVSVLISFMIIRDLTRNYAVALFMVLLFPFADQLIPLNFSFALIGVYMLKKFIHGSQDLKAHFWLFLGLFFLMIWRIDIGLGALLGFALVLFLYMAFKRIKFSAKNILASLSIFALLGSVVGLVLYFNGINILITAKDYLSHISASQSYGFSTLSTDTGSKDQLLFHLHHYVFPISVLLILFYLVFNFKRLANSKQTQFALLSLVFSIGFYLGNFQRGLVRHGFAEHTDLYLSSFVFLIFGGFVYLLFSERSQTLKFIGFMVIIFLFITGFKYEIITPKPLAQLFIFKADKFEQIAHEPNIKRELNPELLAERYEPFKRFVDQELTKDETFIDFSNTPMFYYFTGKQTPSFFFQNPICMHNDHLQQRFLEELENYNAPIILFSRSHMNDEQWGWDYMDFVPNTLRHYKMAEYFYQKYEPFTLVKDHCVWRKKGKRFSKADSLYVKDNYSTRFDTWNIGWIPYLWARYDEKSKKAVVLEDIVNERTIIKEKVDFTIPTKIDRASGNYIRLTISAANRQNVTLRLMYGPGNGEIDLIIPPSVTSNTFLVRISAQYNWYAKVNSTISLSIKENEAVYLEKMSILKGD